MFSVSTYGDGCASLESTELEYRDGGAFVTPLDRRAIPPEGGGCPQILLTFVHRVEVVFPVSGSRTVTVHGRRPSQLGDTAMPIDREVHVNVE